MIKRSKLMPFEIAALVIAAVFTMYSMLRSAEWTVDAGTVAFLAWAASPYLIFFLAGRLFKRFLPLPHLRWITPIIAFLMLAFTLTVYMPPSGERSSTEALAYLVVPIYLYIGSLFLLTLGNAIALFARSRA